MRGWERKEEKESIGKERTEGERREGRIRKYRRRGEYSIRYNSIIV